MEEVLMMRIFFSLALVGLLSFFAHLCNVLLLEPERLRSRLRRQGIRGPPPSILLGNIPQIKLMLSTVPKDPAKEHMGHDCSSTLFPYFKQWTKQYGQLFMFSLGKLQLLYVTDPNVVKAIKVNASLDLGKPAYLQKDRGALLGKGIITTNGAMWIHQRKTIAPELYMDKVKGMLNLMLESGSTLVKSWESRIENEGGLSDIRVDEDVRRYTSYIISKTLFGSSYSEKVEIFPKFSALIEALRSPTLLNGVPGMRYVFF
ncbi:hypothetical protein HHK36_033085 [Tetracentron sinense]|uniref:Cytochrome P450 n=1 Tax=Tetracentron sinense TaxID=13715 RepID=A0A834Y4H1_TETSI|nr:hypothetical protein HHK36_033085 [Tetracentron sinense]